jgi:8-oxo-dGTP pyrophosphatase MutT (NUDIX family)
LITNHDVHDALTAYLQRCPEDARALVEPLHLLGSGIAMTNRSCLPAHVTASALVMDDQDRFLLVHNRALDLTLQPGGHVKPDDLDLPRAALRELVEETGITPGLVELAATTPAYAEYHRIPARPAKAEPAHHHLDLGYLFTTSRPHIGAIQVDEVSSAAWHPRRELAAFLSARVARALSLLKPSAPTSLSIPAAR